jgi:hypothetical protein
MRQPAVKESLEKSSAAPLERLGEMRPARAKKMINFPKLDFKSDLAN